MTQPTLDFAAADPRTVTSSSLAAYAPILAQTPLVNLQMCLHLDDCIRANRHLCGHQYATGGELAWFLGRAVTSVRPRLTMAFNARWIVKGPPRHSRREDEKPCMPYKLAVPRAAVERAIAQAKAAQATKSRSSRKTAVVVGSGEAKVCYSGSGVTEVELDNAPVPTE